MLLQVQQTEASCEPKDCLGLTCADYDRFMEHGKTNNTAWQKRQKLLQSCQYIQQQIENAKLRHQQADIDDTCFQTVHQALSSELQAKESKLAGTDHVKDPMGQYKEAMMFVVKTVEQGCSKCWTRRKRPRVD